MWTLLIVAAGFSAAWCAAQIALCLGYRRAAAQEAGVAEALPKFAVLVPVRGLDPTLLAAIRSAAAQDYPSFTIHILFDSREDEAWTPVRDELAGMNDLRIQVHVIEPRGEACSVLCGSLVEAVQKLDDSHELIAVCAADMIVPRDWLRTMAAAMSDPRAAATLGNRWYLPPSPRPGTLVRWLWNAGAVVLMRRFRIPWSGAMALRLRDVRQNGLLDRWASAMVEDASVAAHFAREPERLRFVPGLIVAHRDAVGLRDAYRFIRRQLLWARLYSPQWPWIAGHAWGCALAFFGPAALALLAAARGDGFFACAGAAVFALYFAAMFLLLLGVESAAGKSPSGPWPRHGGVSPAAVALAIPLTQIVYLAAVCGAARARTVEWRGIRYALDGRGGVRRLGYRPRRAGDSRG